MKPKSILLEIDLLEDFLEEIKVAPTDNDVVFSAIVGKYVASCESSDKDFAIEFGVPVYTVTRWVTGRNTPHPFMRKHIFDWIAGKVDSRVKAKLKELHG